jgi:hypothetical protein
MELFTYDVCKFLNELDTYVPLLLKDSTLNIIQKNVILDINSMILHGNEFAILNRIAQLIVKTMFNVPELYIKTTSLACKDNDTEYLLSDYHMEFELNEKALNYIKSIIYNSTISNRGFVFIIKNAEANINRNLFLELRRLMDINHTSKFIITTSSISFIEKSLSSRCLLLNCCFPLSKIISGNIIPNEYNISHEIIKNIYIETKGNIINLLQNIHIFKDCNNTVNYSQVTSMLWQKNIDKLFDTFKNTKNELIIINNIRELVYKLYHMGIPLRDICNYIVHHYLVIQCNVNKEKTVSKKVNKEIEKLNNICYEVVKICALSEHNGTNNRNILSFEQLFIGLYKILVKYQCSFPLISTF